MPDVMKKQREARRKIIHQWSMLPRGKRQSIEEISAFAKTAAQQNENAFVHSHRDPYEKIMGGYCHVLISSERATDLRVRHERGLRAPSCTAR